MRTTFLLTLFIAVVLAAGCSSSGHYSSLSKERAAQMVADNIAGRDIIIEVDRARPLRGRTVNLTSSYSLKISGDSVYSHLPYYGRAYSVPYGGGEGLIFSSMISDYSATQGKKGETQLRFSTRTWEDNVSFTVTLWPTGPAEIYVQPVNRQAISYSGKMVLETP